MSLLDSSKQVLAIFSKDKDQKLAIVNANASELLMEQNSISYKLQDFQNDNQA